MPIKLTKKITEMKRSEKLTFRARNTAWLAVIILGLSVALVCWVPVAILSESSDPGGIAMAWAAGTLSILGLVAVIGLLLEAIRLARLARIERGWEHEREIRPRI